MRCSACGFEGAAGARFCASCGQALAQREAERRQVTVLFCDVVGSTRLSEQLDPEDLRDVVRAYQDMAGACVDRYQGHVAQYLGDGVLVYFGYPRAHEDDAVRALHAGLEIVAGLQDLNASLADRGVELSLRLGAHTGGVVAGQLGSGASQEDLALGVVPNVAARLEAMAEPNTILVSSETHRLVQHHFVCESLGARQLKGISAPVEVYRVVRDREETDGAPSGSQAPLRGRAAEAELLRRHFAQAAAGAGRTLLLEGEPGIGKTRLVTELHRHVGDGATWLQCSCSAIASTSALYPIATMLARTFELRRGASAADAMTALEAGLRGFGERAGEMLPLFADLLSILQDEDHPSLDASPDRKRQRTFEALIELLAQWSEERPVVLALEDLHWADPSTLEFIGQLAASPPEGLLALLTTRGPFDPPWLHHVERLSLTGLREEQIAELVADAAGERTLAPDVLHYVAQRTDGIPFFAWELTNAILESGVLREGPQGFELESALTDRIPTTLRGSLTARIDRLPEARPVAQLGATIGREFSYAILREVSELPEEALRRALEQLVKAEILDQHGEPPSARYSFRHALIQEAAYELLLKRVRRDHHARIARVLVESFPQRTEIQPELVARHFSEAGHAREAIHYWRQAGERAIKRSAMAEAIAHLEAGLALLADQPDTPERDGEELAFQIALGSASLHNRGFSAPEVERTYLRAQELSRRVGSRPEQFWAFQGLAVYHLVRAELDEMLRTAGSMLELATDSGDPVHEAAARTVYGVAWFFRGDFRSALDWQKEAIEAQPPGDRSMRDAMGFDLMASGHGWSSLALWHLGEFERSREFARRAIALGKETRHASSLAQVMVFAGCELQHFRRDYEGMRRHALELLQLSRDRGFPIWEMQATLFEGAARAQLLEDAELPDFAPTAERMAGTLALYRASGSRLALAFFSSLWAETLMRLSRREEAAKLLDESIGIAESSGDRMWLAEQWRLRGTLAVQAGDADAGESAFRLALETARHQGSRALELRAALSLDGLLRERGGRAETRALLAAVCNGFDPKEDSPELREARARLA